MTESGNLARAINAWRAQLGPEAVLDADGAQRAYGASTTGAMRSIAAALTPKSVEEVRAIVTTAAEYRVPLYPFSTGHNWGYGCSLPARDGCAILDLSRLKRIAIDAERGLASLEPGVTQQDLSDYLDA